MKRTTPVSKFELALRDFALTFPGAYEEFPWGDRAIKVKKKIFAILGAHQGVVAISLKLSRSREQALMFDFAEATGYGLGKSGWITARIGAKAKPPIGLLRAWIDESYRAIAPKTLVAQLEFRDEGAAARPSRTAKSKRRTR